MLALLGAHRILHISRIRVNVFLFSNVYFITLLLEFYNAFEPDMRFTWKKLPDVCDSDVRDGFSDPR
jgi:hypothetical protein